MKTKFKDTIINYRNSLYYSVFEKIIYSIKRKKFEKKTNPKVTIYTPTKNRADILLSRAVKGVLSQTYKNFEYLIIGDYCTDSTEKKIKEINDPRVKYYELRDEGIHYQKLDDIKKIWCRGGAIPSNFALRKANGDWIARCDDDEEWTASFLEKSINFANNNELDFVSAGSIYAKDNSDLAQSNNTTHKLYSDYFDTSKFLKNNTNTFIGAPSTWVMRSYLRLFKFNENSWRKEWNQVNDIDFVVRLAYCGVKCGYIDQKLVYQIPRTSNNATGFLGATKDYKSMFENS